jgi:hypothetical protein
MHNNLDELQMPDEERLQWKELGVNTRTLPASGRLRRRLLRYFHSEEHIPKWRVITALHPETEMGFSREDRRGRVRYLVNAAAWLIRRELKLHDTDPQKDERTVYWDPLVEVCRELQIPRSKLSAYSKEFNGLSVSQLVDALKAERVTLQMRVALRAFLKSLKTAQHGDTEALSNSQNNKDLDRWQVWKALKASRREPDFAHTTWAQEFGFASYTRFYRACLVVHKRTPHQLEMEIIDELLKEEDGTELPDKRARPEKTLETIEAEIQKLITFEDQTQPWRAFTERKT